MGPFFRQEFCIFQDFGSMLVPKIQILVPFWFQKSKFWFQKSNFGSILVPQINFWFPKSNFGSILVPKLQFWFHFGSKTSILVPFWGPLGPHGAHGAPGAPGALGALLAPLCNTEIVSVLQRAHCFGTKISQKSKMGPNWSPCRRFEHLGRGK